LQFCLVDADLQFLVLHCQSLRALHRGNSLCLALLQQASQFSAGGIELLQLKFQISDDLRMLCEPGGQLRHLLLTAREAGRELAFPLGARVEVGLDGGEAGFQRLQLPRQVAGRYRDFIQLQPVCFLLAEKARNLGLQGALLFRGTLLLAQQRLCQAIVLFLRSHPCCFHVSCLSLQLCPQLLQLLQVYALC
jgi:hypothetical protein